MRLIIGGFAQGKLDHVLQGLRQEKAAFQVLNETSDLDLCRIDASLRQAGERPYTLVVDHLHEIVRHFADQQKAVRWMDELLAICGRADAELILICDELGNGLIPASYEDRCFRENAGRVLCEAARRADRVERIICGIPCIIKA